ncbi:MAG: CBS domain-containing protein [Candidatus Methylarchaceae archaeon HK02M2]|nr:CBS domain-containing protein [Candidatus Methylarchaceae archaeon HK02M2]
MSGILMVRDVMTKNVKTVGIYENVREAVQKMNKFNIGSVVVVDTERRRPIGIVTERDILRMVELHSEPKLFEIKKIMSTPLVTINPNTDIEDAAKLMTKKRIKRLPVIENDRLVGIITSSDIMKASPKLVSVFMDLLREIS